MTAPATPLSSPPTPPTPPTPSMGVPPAAVALVKRFEGFAKQVKRSTPVTAVPYLCPAGFWTIGYGHLCTPAHPAITEGEAEVYLAQDLIAARSATLRLCPVLIHEPEHRLAAIIDFTFNLGAGRLQTSTLRVRINQRNWTEAARELRRWVHGGGKVLPGLVLRRDINARYLLGSDLSIRSVA